MLSDSGEKLYLSSGIASAASTICFSLTLTWRSTRAAMVVGGWGAPCAWGAGVAGLAAGAGFDPWLTAAVAALSTTSRQTIRRCFMDDLLFEWCRRKTIS